VVSNSFSARGGIGFDWALWHNISEKRARVQLRGIVGVLTIVSVTLTAKSSGWCTPGRDEHIPKSPGPCTQAQRWTVPMAILGGR
jgi:hypothetical protein